MDEWMGNKESIVHIYIYIVHIYSNGNETIFYSHVITSFLFLYILKAKANNSQSTSWCPLKNVAITYSVLRSDVGESHILSINRRVGLIKTSHSNVTSIHPSNSKIHRFRHRNAYGWRIKTYEHSIQRTNVDDYWSNAYKIIFIFVS